MKKSSKTVKTPKTANSKNDPHSRQKRLTQKIVGGKPVSPVRFIDPTNRRNFMAGMYSGGDLIFGEDGVPLHWSQIKSEG